MIVTDLFSFSFSSFIIDFPCSLFIVILLEIMEEMNARVNNMPVEALCRGLKSMEEKD